jgi:pilus assembly protein CpaC
VNFQSIVSGLLANAIGTGVVPTISSQANLQLAVVPSQFYVAMQALRTEGIAKFLSEPKVITQTGRPAFFRSGGQQAILSSTSGITGPGVTLAPFGTELEVLPIVYGNGMIWLEINPKITAVSQGLGITVGGANSPGFTEQQVRAAVLLESGQTYAIGGLIQNTISASSSKVPFLGDLPFLGVGFSTVTHTQTESELVIMVTPRLVGPMNCDQVPKRVPGRESRNPDDYELFLENILEAPRGQRKVWNGHCYNAAYKCDPTAAIFPCVGGVCNGSNRLGAPGCTYPPVTTTPVGSASGVPSKLPPIPQTAPTSGGAIVLPVPGSPVDGSGALVEPLVGGSYPPASTVPVTVVPDVPRN